MDCDLGLHSFDRTRENEEETEMCQKRAWHCQETGNRKPNKSAETQQENPPENNCSPFSSVAISAEGKREKWELACRWDEAYKRLNCVCRDVTQTTQDEKRERSHEFISVESSVTATWQIHIHSKHDVCQWPCGAHWQIHLITNKSNVPNVRSFQMKFAVVTSHVRTYFETQVPVCVFCPRDPGAFHVQ